MQDFEGAFSEYIDCNNYDRAQEALFTIIREAFRAGWLAANGELPVNKDLGDAS